MTQSKNFLALALAVLPASVSAGHCYVQYQTGKAAQAPNQANWAATDQTELYTKHDLAGADATAKWTILAKITGGTAAYTTGPAPTKEQFAAAHKPTDLQVARTYFKEDTCTNSLHKATKVDGFEGIKVTDLASLKATTANAADNLTLSGGSLAADGANLTIASARVLTGNALRDRLKVDFGMKTTNPAGIDVANNGLVLSDPRTGGVASKVGNSSTPSASGVDNGACMELDTDFFYDDSAVAALTSDDNVITELDGSVSDGLEGLYWAQSNNYKGAGKIETAMKAVTAKASENLKVPTHLTVKITSDNKLAFTYHAPATTTPGSECTSANAVAWPFAAGSTCLPARGVTNAECKGVNGCVDDVITALEHLDAKKADDCKPWAAAGDGGPRCTAKCLCPAAKATRETLQKLVGIADGNRCTVNGWYAKLGLVNPGLAQSDVSSIASSFDVGAVKLLNTAMAKCGEAVAAEDTKDAAMLTDYLGTHGLDGSAPALCNPKGNSGGATAQFAPLTGLVLLIGAALL